MSHLLCVHTQHSPWLRFKSKASLCRTALGTTRAYPAINTHTTLRCRLLLRRSATPAGGRRCRLQAGKVGMPTQHQQAGLHTHPPEKTKLLQRCPTNKPTDSQLLDCPCHRNTHYSESCAVCAAASPALASSATLAGHQASRLSSTSTRPSAGRPNAWQACCSAALPTQPIACAAAHTCLPLYSTAGGSWGGLA